MNNFGLDFSQLNANNAIGDKGLDIANMSGEQLNNIVKAMEAGHIQGGDVGNADQTNMGALKTESLEASLKIITFNESEIRLWKRVPKGKANSTVEEYNQLTSYGIDRGGYLNEGELPEEEDSQYERKLERVKYLGVTRSVTHQAQLVQSQVGNQKAQENENGIRYILQKADRGLLYGDSAVTTQAWNGLYAQHVNNTQYATLEEYMTSPLVIDMRGTSLTEASIDEGTRVLIENHAQPNLLIGPPAVFSDFARNFYARQRLALNSGSLANVEAGNRISSFQSQFGRIEFEYDIFANRGSVGKRPAIGANSAKAPSTPTAGAAPAAPVADANLTRFGDGAGDYFYSVAAINRFGESAMLQLGAGAVTVAANQAVDLEFTATAGAYPTTAFIVYRSEANPLTAYADTVMYPIMEVPATGVDVKRGSLAGGVDGGAAGFVRDRNRFIANTENCLLMQGDKRVYEFKQLAPLMKMDLARLAPADRWMILMYGTPIMYAPSKVVRYINVGR